ncbi:MAG: acylneuraminate cytidylyltransferase family protein, partial [Patescibacteria group bacterium]|nr:acylneuraminate cytidylyltransferase family protein [Patescibacteria group bacterium]
MKNKERVIAIIIARGGSKSIPRKNVLPLQGKPLVAWPIDLAKSVSRIDRVIVSTDNDEISAIAKKHGAEVPFKRPAELSTDEVPTLPVLQHCVKYLEEQENYKPDIVLLLYPTMPFLKKERIEEALNLFGKTKCSSIVSVTKDKGRFWKLDENKNKYRPFYPAERVNRQYYQPLYKEDGAVYFSRYDVLMKINKLIDEDNIEFIIMEDGENIDIDD